jgi:hypothetical protein
MNRVCPVCGASLEGRKRDAVYCSPGCRREQGRIRAVLTGRSDGPYSSLGDLAERRKRRAKPGILRGPNKWGRVAQTTGPVAPRESTSRRVGNANSVAPSSEQTPRSLRPKETP